mgnify:CR=1 FL=1
MQNKQDTTVAGALSRAVMAAALSVTVMAAGLVAVAGVAGAAEGSIGAGATILTGKVVTTVTRAIPVPFNAVVDDVLVKPGQAVEILQQNQHFFLIENRSHRLPPSF